MENTENQGEPHVEPMENHDNKLSETFDNFGEVQQQIEKTESVPVGGIAEEAKEVIEEVKKIEEDIDVNNTSLEDILKKLNFELLPKDDITPNYNQVFVKNKYFKLYYAKSVKFSACSLMVLNDVENKKNDLFVLLSKLSMLNSITCKALLRIRGISIDGNKCFILFEPILANYRRKLRENTKLDESRKFCTLFYLAELIFQCHEKEISLLDINLSTLLYNNLDEFRYLIPYAEFTKFNMHHENIEEKFEEEMKFDRYRSPEQVIEDYKGICNDVWLVGCVFVELFSTSEIWAGYSEEEMIRDLKKYYVPKIHKDIPKHCWGLICECLNPFRDARIEGKELIEKFAKLMFKLKIPELAKDLGKNKKLI
jgi:serine/threonine protein kinase